MQRGSCVSVREKGEDRGDPACSHLHLGRPVPGRERQRPGLHAAVRGSQVVLQSLQPQQTHVGAPGTGRLCSPGPLAEGLPCEGSKRGSLRVTRSKRSYGVAPCKDDASPEDWRDSGVCKPGQASSNTGPGVQPSEL